MLKMQLQKDTHNGKFIQISLMRKWVTALSTYAVSELKYIQLKLVELSFEQFNVLNGQKLKWSD